MTAFCLERIVFWVQNYEEYLYVARIYMTSRYTEYETILKGRFEYNKTYRVR